VFSEDEIFFVFSEVEILSLYDNAETIKPTLLKKPSPLMK